MQGREVNMACATCFLGGEDNIILKMKLSDVRKKVLDGVGISKEEALSVLSSDEKLFLSLCEIAQEARERFFGRKVDLCSIVNARSGYCSEDCAFCAQSKVSRAPINKYPFLGEEKIISAAREAKRNGAGRFGIVMSGKRLNDGDVEIVSRLAEAIRKEIGIEVDLSAGILTEKQAEKLRSAGIVHYNHNLETSPRHYRNLCTTHSFEDRLNTLKVLRKYEFELCSGGIFGTGENDEDIVELAFILKEVGVSTIPLNFLIPIKGTPLENRPLLSPERALRIICTFRLIHPDKVIKVCGGREVVMREREREIFMAGANGIIIGNYLTVPGNPPEKDLQMLSELGLSPF